MLVADGMHSHPPPKSSQDGIQMSPPQNLHLDSAKLECTEATLQDLGKNTHLSNSQRRKRFKKMLLLLIQHIVTACPHLFLPWDAICQLWRVATLQLQLLAAPRHLRAHLLTPRRTFSISLIWTIARNKNQMMNTPS